MRIVGGDLRGRKLAQPKSQNIRPTTDRNRESLFNIIQHNWPEKLKNGRVLDVFAGTGAFGCEALSRGASHVAFIELSSEGSGLIHQNMESLGISDRSALLRRDASRPGSNGGSETFDLVFADPPYAKGLGEKAAIALARGSWLSLGALFILEENRDSLPIALDGFDKTDERQFGDTAIGFFEYVTV